ncbi:MAG: hypothetical protein FJY99_00760 [Candidatus Sericytochromatia bacterium]|nr:hypothetical protein [Candidatus Tanganyikabacteria bacterium]
MSGAGLLIAGWFARSGGSIDLALDIGPGARAERIYGGRSLRLEEGRLRGTLGPWGLAVLAVR